MKETRFGVMSRAIATRWSRRELLAAAAGATALAVGCVYDTDA